MRGLPTFLLINRDDAFICLEVRAFCARLRCHPHALTLARNRLRSLHIGQYNVTIEILAVYPLRWGIKAGSTVSIARFL